MGDTADVLSQIKFQKQENELLSAKIAKLLNEEKILTEKKDRLEEQLQLKQDEYENKKKEKNQDPLKGPNNKESENDAERREKKLDDWLKSKILGIILDNDELTEFNSELDKKLNKTMIIGSVLIRYLPNVGDGEWEAFEKADPNEAYFKISEETTFEELKRTACQFWKIEESDLIGLRSSNYALLDLHMKKKVEETILRLRMAPEFWLFKINKFSKKTFTELKDCFIDSNTASNFKIGEDNKRVVNTGNGFNDSVHRRNFTKIEGIYKGLSKYKAPPKVNLEAEREKLTDLENGFKTCFACFFILVLTLVILFNRRSVTDDYFIQSSLNTELIKGPEGINFFQISSLNDFHNYTKYSFGPTVFNSGKSDSSSLSDRYKIVGKIRMRQVRTKEVKCKRKSAWKLEDTTCYGQDYLTEKFDEDIDADVDAFVYHSSTSGPSLIVGDICNYDSSGFYKDFDSSDNYDAFIKQYEYLQNKTWLDMSTRAVFINFNIFLPNKEQFIAVYILIEISVSGVIRPSRLSSRVLYSNLNSGSSSNKAMMALEVIRLLLSFYMLFIYIITGLKKNQNGKREFYNWIKPNNLLNLFIFGFIVTTFSFALYVNKDPKDIITNEEYYDMSNLYFYYYTSLLINAWLLIFIFFRMIITMKFSNTINKNLEAIDLSTKSYMYYLLFLLPIIICLSLITAHMFGPYNYNYSTPKLVAVSNILFTMGEGDIDEFFKVSQAWTIGFLIIYFLIIMFFLYSSYIGILIDSYRISSSYNEKFFEAIKSNPDFVPWKIWLFNDCKRCRKKKPVDEGQNI